MFWNLCKSGWDKLDVQGCSVHNWLFLKHKKQTQYIHKKKLAWIQTKITWFLGPRADYLNKSEVRTGLSNAKSKRIP